MTRSSFLPSLLFVSFVGACGGSTAFSAEPFDDGGDHPADAGHDATSDVVPDTTKDAPHDRVQPDGPQHDAPSDVLPTCPSGEVTFQLDVAAPDAGAYCKGTGCGGGWVTISGPDDVTFDIEPPCITTCADCEPIVCVEPNCVEPTPLGSDGAHQTWDGTYYPRSTCGDNVTCIEPSCAPPGRYTASMCASQCFSGQQPTCVSVEFDWPPAGGTATVRGVLGQPAVIDAGAVEAGDN